MEQNKIENNQTNATISASVPEQNVTTTGVARSASGENMMAAGGKKKSNGMLYGMILCAVLAIGGIGFGVWAMMDGNSQKNSYEEQISALKKQNNELQEKIENNTDSGTVVDIDVDNSGSGGGTSVTSGPYISDGYFNVPEWGLKFKIPDDLANYGYSVDYDTAHAGGTLPQVGFTAMLKSDIRDDAIDRYYDNIETCAIVSVSKEPKDWNKYGINGIIKEFDDYKLLIWNYTSHGSCDSKLHIDEVQAKIQEMFSNPEAY